LSGQKGGQRYFRKLPNKRRNSSIGFNSMTQ
jgi:hypothetical protein